MLAWPIRDDGEVELGTIFRRLADFQFAMSVEGFFIRGGVAVGEAYVDDLAVFGDALTQAYLAESALARDPRIVLANSAVDLVKHHLGYYGNSRYAPQASELLCDSDGQWFVNYLDTVLFVADEYGPFYDEFLKHKRAVELKLARYKAEPAIFAKYAWVANYHNYFCDIHKRYFSDEHKIATELFRARPRSIVEDES